MARVLLGVTGGIAAYKACELCACSSRRARGAAALTPGAEGFVRAETFEALARASRPRRALPAPRRAPTCSSIAPLSANTLAKLAHGLADNVLTQAALAFRGPVLVAPAMNVRMWEHPATQANVATAARARRRADRPGEGELAEGENGVGRMSEPEAIFAPRRELLGADRPARGQARARHRGRDARAARRGALRRQPLVGPDGRRARRGGAAARRAR